MAGLYFEQFEVGQRFVHEIRRTVTDMDNMLFSGHNPMISLPHLVTAMAGILHRLKEVHHFELIGMRLGYITALESW